MKKTIKTPWIRKKKFWENKLYGVDSVLDRVGAACEKQKEKKSPWNMVGENFHPVNDLRAFADKPH